MLPLNHAIEKRETLTVVSGPDDWRHRQLSEDDPRSYRETHKDQYKTGSAHLHPCYLPGFTLCP